MSVTMPDTEKRDASKLSPDMQSVLGAFGDDTTEWLLSVDLFRITGLHPRRRMLDVLEQLEHDGWLTSYLLGECWPLEDEQAYRLLVVPVFKESDARRRERQGACKATVQYRHENTPTRNTFNS